MMIQVLKSNFCSRYLNSFELLPPCAGADNQAVVYDFWVGGDFSGRLEPGFQREITIFYLLLWLTRMPQGRGC